MIALGLSIVVDGRCVVNYTSNQLHLYFVMSFVKDFGAKYIRVPCGALTGCSKYRLEASIGVDTRLGAEMKVLLSTRTGVNLCYFRVNYLFGFFFHSRHMRRDLY